MTTATTAQRPAAQRLARYITEATAPAISLVVLLPLVGWHAARGTAAGLAWGLLATVFAAAIPMAYIVRGVRRGHITDHHVGVRQQRRTPLIVGLVSVSVGCVVMALLGAPRELLALLVAGIVGLVVSVTISHWWKISLHTAVAAGSITILVLVFGPLLLPLAVLLVPIAWARVTLTDHTIAQVISGACVGTIIAATAFTALR